MLKTADTEGSPMGRYEVSSTTSYIMSYMDATHQGGIILDGLLLHSPLCNQDPSKRQCAVQAGHLGIECF